MELRFNPRHLLSFPAVIFLYSLAVFTCCALRPLWLDEVLELSGTTMSSLAAMLNWVPVMNAGATPLGYLTQRPFVLAGGPWPFWARLPSALFSIFSCWLMLWICRELRIPRTTGMIAVVIFMLIPSQFRYATEGRPYTEALCFSLISALALIKLTRKPTVLRAVICISATIAGLYTQPYSVLPACGMIVWILAAHRAHGEWKNAVLLLLCVAISALAFVPWYLRASGAWRAAIASAGYPQFHWTLPLFRDVAKGISGGSFLCSAALLVSACAGIFASLAPLELRGMLSLGAVFAVVGALAGDALNNYFFASRQIIFCLPSLCILASLGCSHLAARNRLLGLGIGALLLIASLTNDISFQVNAKEDWIAAARALDRTAGDGYCLEFLGQGPDLYSVFVPGLRSKTCGAPPPPKVALVSTLYTDPGEIASAEKNVQALGFSQRGVLLVGGTRIALETR
jgi:uncharacterized membrane protein